MMNGSVKLFEDKQNTEKLENRLTKLEVNQEHTEEKIDELTSDMKEVKAAVFEIKEEVLSSRGFFNGLKFTIPYLIALISMIVTMAVYVGHEQRIKEQDKIERSVEVNSKKIEVISDFIVGEKAKGESKETE